MLPIVNASLGSSSTLQETDTPQFQSHCAESGGFGLKHGGLKIVLAALLFFILFFYCLGSYPFFDPDEPRYAETARQMIEYGHWITPYFNGLLRLDKPPLFYWMIAGAYRLFGVSEFSARFCSAGAATVTLLMVYGFARHWISGRAGWFSALILGTSLFFIGIARMSITDMTLTAWMTGATLCLFMAAHRNSRWWLGAGAFAGLGLLTKGPVGLVAPLSIFGLYWLTIGAPRRVWQTIWMPLGLLLSLCIALPWYLLVYREVGPLFGALLLRDNITRYSAVVSGHQQPLWYYTVVLLAGFLPWTAYLPSALLSLWQRVRSGHRERVARGDFGYLTALYAAIWTGFIFIFFSVAQTRLPTYILPLFPALALCLGEAWSLMAVRVSPDTRVVSLKDSEASRCWLLRGSQVLLLAFSAAGILFILRMEAFLPREAQGITANGFSGFGVILMLLGTALTSRFLSRRRLTGALFAQALTIVLTLIVVLQGILPAVSLTAQGKMRHYLALSGSHPLMLYDLQRPSLTFYGRRTIPRFGGKEGRFLLQALRQHSQAFLITRNTRVTDVKRLCADDFQIRLVDKDRVFSLLYLRHRTPTVSSSRVASRFAPSFYRIRLSGFNFRPSLTGVPL